MTTAFLRNVLTLSVGAMLASASVASASTIYNNSVNDLNYRFNPGTLEVGDEIIVGGTDRFLTGFSFEYWALANGLPSGSFAGTPQVQVKFYLNDGAAFNGYATPGTVFYDSGWFNIAAPTDRSTLVYDTTDFGGGFYIPFGAGISNFTWSVQFQGLGGTDTAGVDIYNPPTIGGNHTDYWEHNGSWSLKTNAVVEMNFAATFEAAVPEPTSMALGLVGGLGLLVMRWRMAKK